MTRHDELLRILKTERLRENDPEMSAIREARADIEGVLARRFGTTDVTVRYGGSKAKGMMLKSAYDLDILDYFGRDNDRAGRTLPEIYKSVGDALREHYIVEERTTALRLYAKENGGRGKALHIDVVPGRFIDDSRTDVFLHQKDAEQGRLKTNPDKQIEYVTKSGVVDGTCALKLWRVKNGLLVKQFPFEIMCVDILKPKKHLVLADQVRHGLTEIAEMTRPPVIVDPGNVSRDLSVLLTPDVWNDLHTAASQSLERLEWSNWSDIMMTEPISVDIAAVAATVKSAQIATKPWCDDPE